MHDEFSAYDVLRILRERKWSVIIWTLALGLAAALWILQSPPRYSASTTILVGAQSAPLPEGLSGFAPPPEPQVLDHLAALSSTSLAAQVIDRLGLAADYEYRPEAAPVGTQLSATQKTEMLRKFLEHLKVSNVPDTNVLEVRFESIDPEKAAEVANTLGNEFLNLQMNADQERMVRVSSWLDKRTEQLQNTIVDLEIRLTTMRQVKDLPITALDLQERQQQLLSEQLLRLTAQKEDVTARLDLVQGLSRGADQANVDLGDSNIPTTLQSLLERKIEAQKDIAALSASYGPKHPAMVAAIAQRSQIASQLRNEARRVTGMVSDQVQVLQRREREIKAQLAAVSSESSDNYIDNIALERFEREIAAKKARLEALLGYQDTLAQQQELDIQAPAARVIAPAIVPHRASSPSRIGLLLVALFAGSLIGVVWAFLRELLDNRIRTARQVQTLTGSTPVGQLPQLETAGPSFSEETIVRKPQGRHAIAIRNVQWQFNLQNQGRLPKSVVVTSAQAGEGKTSVAASLARSRALSGARVLLIDANHQHPSIDRELQLQYKPQGLSNLFKSKLEFYRLLVKDPKTSLHVLGPGTRPTDAGRLFANPNMDRILRYAESRYDTVIIDAPALAAGPEALLLSRKVRATLLVVDCRSANRDQLLDAVNRLQGDADSAVGIVLNQMREKAASPVYMRQPRRAEEARTADANVISVTFPSAETPKEPTGKHTSPLHADMVEVTSVNSEASATKDISSAALEARSKQIIEALIKIAEREERPIDIKESKVIR